MRSPLGYWQRDALERAWREVEWRRCAEDFYYFLENYAHVQTGASQSGAQTLTPWKPQRKFIDMLLGERFVIVLKCRQIGFTTLVMAWAFWQAFFHDHGERVLVLSRKKDATQENLKIAKLIYRLLPEWMRQRGPELVQDRAEWVWFRWPSGVEAIIQAEVANAQAGASFAVTRVVFDELALAKEATDAYQTVRSTLDHAEAAQWRRGALMVALSTARGGSNLFARLYKGARRGVNQFKALFIPWHDSPIITEEVREAKRREFESNGTPWKIHSEYPATEDEAFTEGGAHRFTNRPDTDAAERREADLLEFRGDIVDGDRPDSPQLVAANVAADGTSAGPLRLFVHPDDIDHSRDYLVSADTSSGSDMDYHALLVLSRNPDRGVVEVHGYWHSNGYESSDVGRVIGRLGRLFHGPNGPALAVIENVVEAGAAPIAALREDGYPHHRIYRYKPDDRAKARREWRYGFPMSRTRRPQVIDTFAGVLAGDELDPIPGLLAGEINAFIVNEKGRAEADSGEHDDLVMSAAMGCHVLLSEPAMVSPWSPDEPEPDPTPEPDNPLARHAARILGELHDVEQMRRAAFDEQLARDHQRQEVREQINRDREQRLRERLAGV